jgi:hypothetical protein
MLMKGKSESLVRWCLVVPFVKPLRVGRVKYSNPVVFFLTFLWFVWMGGPDCCWFAAFWTGWKLMRIGTLNHCSIQGEIVKVGHRSHLDRCHWKFSVDLHGSYHG